MQSTDRIVEVVKCRMKFEVMEVSGLNYLYILISYSHPRVSVAQLGSRAEGKDGFFYSSRDNFPPAPVIVGTSRKERLRDYYFISRYACLGRE